jgi:putative transposase
VIELPRSTYYYRSSTSDHGLTDVRLVGLIGDIHEEFPGYGYRRVTLELLARGYCVNHKRVARIMRENALGALRRRRFVRTTDSDHANPVFPNLYRNRIPDRPNLVWVADITYVSLASGFAYVAVILDACSRKVVGYAIGRHIDTELTLAALQVAMQTRMPEPGTCIHHSDRGAQYASTAYCEALGRYGLRGSMSAVGNPYDNAQAESFMKTLKVEEVYLAGYETFTDAASRLPMFIDDVYNARRMHSSIGYLPPNRFEELLAQQAT